MVLKWRIRQVIRGQEVPLFQLTRQLIIASKTFCLFPMLHGFNMLLQSLQPVASVVDVFVTHDTKRHAGFVKFSDEIPSYAVSIDQHFQPVHANAWQIGPFWQDTLVLCSSNFSSCGLSSVNLQRSLICAFSWLFHWTRKCGMRFYFCEDLCSSTSSSKIVRPCVCSLTFNRYFLACRFAAL